MAQSFPPPGFVPTQSAVEGITVFKPAPTDVEQHRETVDFSCPQCGGVTAFSASDGGLTCTNCDYYEPPQKQVVGKRAEQFEFTVDTMERAARGWGDSRKELQCQSCGAYTSVPPASLTHTCPFCGSNKVIQREAPQDMLRPRYLIPFKIEADACHTFARQWMGSSWMTPGALKKVAQVANFNGIYLPFWNFDATAKASWKAQVGHTQTERYYSGGKWRTRTKTVWKWESGNVQLGLHDVLIEGTSHISRLLLRRLRGYNLHDLAPYEAKYLAGYQAQTYDIPLEPAWEEARHEMREQTRQACRDQASTSQIRNFSMEMGFADELWRYVLLPVYLANYTYQQKTYQVMVNGQTGHVSGQRPVDWLKVWLAVVGLTLPGLGLGVIGLVTLIFAGLGLVIGIIGFILLIIGLAWGFKLIRTAQEMDDA